MKKIGLFLLMSTSLVLSAQAKNNGEWDWVDKPTRDWFKSLRNSKGFVCCDVADGHAAIWKRDDSGFHVIIDKKWYKVPDDVVLWRTPNKIGEALVWYSWRVYHQDGSTDPADLTIRCFLPESEI